MILIGCLAIKKLQRSSPKKVQQRQLPGAIRKGHQTNIAREAKKQHAAAAASVIGWGTAQTPTAAHLGASGDKATPSSHPTGGRCSLKPLFIFFCPAIRRIWRQSRPGLIALAKAVLQPRLTVVPLRATALKTPSSQTKALISHSRTRRCVPVTASRSNANHITDQVALSALTLDAADKDTIAAVLEQGTRPKGDCYQWERGIGPF